MNYKLLAADMDGTLLNNDSVMTERTKRAVLAAIAKGVLFVPSTGRPLRGVAWLNALFPEDLPFVIFNGAMAVTGKSKKILYSQSLAYRHAKEIFDLGTARDIPVIFWIDERLYANRECEATRMYQEITGAEMQVAPGMHGMEGQGITKMIWIAPPEEALRYQAELRDRFRGTVNCHTSRPYLLEFVDAGASKARALEEIGSIYGIDKSEMIAVGDSYNDTSMLEYAGLGVAMGNAPDDIKKICQHTTLRNDEDGVAALIEHFILKG